MSLSYARIENGRVVEIIQANEVPLEQRFHPDIVVALMPVSANEREGWVFEGGVLNPPAPAVAAAAVPQTIALWQFRRELRVRGWWDQVQAAVAGLPAEARADVEEWLEYGTEVQRASPLLETLAAAIGVAEQIDDAFYAAAARVL